MDEALSPGTMLGHLRVERELGRGGFASVYLAEDTRLRRQVALKVLHNPMRPRAHVDGFLEEARVIARWQSPHIVTLFSLREREDNALVLEMEYVPGGALDEILLQGPLSPPRVQRLVLDVLTGLGVAHEDGVLHRDVKPGNILLAGDGAAKLSDFGLAMVMEESAELDEGPKGTPYYMAPEVLAGGPATVQSDLWSVGVVAYQSLTGHPPFAASDPVRFFVAVQDEHPLPLPVAIPPALTHLVEACLQKDPTRRPSSCAEARAMLETARVRQPEPLAAPDSAERAPELRGRENELSRFESALRDDDVHGLVITGAAGIGKTALCAEAGRRARKAGTFWVDAKLSGVEGPLVTLVQAVRTATSFGADASTGAFGSEEGRMKGILRGEEMPALDSPQQALWTLQRLFQGVAHDRPLVLCVDDVQHASEDDVSFLAHVSQHLSDRDFKLVLATRPAAHVTGGLREAERLDLGGLDEEALFDLLEDRLEAVLPGRLVAHIHARTEGNPLHAIELAHHLEQTGALERRDTHLEPTDGWAQASFPVRLQDLVHSRLTLLDVDDRELLEVAAVDGVEFDSKAVAAVHGIGTLPALRRFQALSRVHTVVGRAEHGYRFSDRVTQEVLYEDMAPELRVEVHRALAEHLEARGEAGDPARIGRHWERCGERLRASPYLLQVADGARQHGEPARLLEFAERGGLLDDPPLVDLERHVELALAVAGSLLRQGDRDQGEALFDRLARAVERRGDLGETERIAVRRATIQLVNGIRPEGDADAWDGVADGLGATLDGALARAVAGRLAKLEGDFDRARGAFERADAIFQEVGSDWYHSGMQDQLGSVAMRAHRLEEARAHYRVAAEVAEGIGVLHNAAISRLNGALAQMMAERVDGVDHEIRRAIRGFDLSGATVHAAQARIYLAEAVYAAGDTRAALKCVDEAIPVLTDIAHRAALTNAWRLRAEFLGTLGNLEEAETAIAHALSEEESQPDRTQRIVAHAVEALLATAAGRVADAQHAIDAMEAANPDGTVPADGSVLALTEAVLIGLPGAALERVGHLARSETELLLRDAALSHARREPCEAALEALEACEIGLRRTTYRLFIDWLAAESAERRGDDPEVARRKAAVAKTAALLGHERARRWASAG